MAKEQTTSKNTKGANTKKNSIKVSKKTIPAKKNLNQPKVLEPKKEEKVLKRNNLNRKENKYNSVTLSKKTVIGAGIIMAILLITVIVLVFTKHIPKISNGSEVIASINGKKVTANDLYTTLKNTYGQDELLNIIDGYIADKEIEVTDEVTQYVDNVVEYYKQYASYYGVSFEDFLKQYVNISNVTTEEQFRAFVLKDYKKQLVLTKYISDKLTDDEINTYYDANYSKKYTVKHILIEVDDNDDAAAKKEAQNLIKKLKAKIDNSEELNKLFDEYAKKYSTDTATAQNGGLMENIAEKDVVSEFWKAVEELKDGELTATPVKTDYGYHIILKVSTTEKEALEDVLTAVKEGAANEKLTNDANLQVTAMAELRDKYNLSIKDDSIKELYLNAVKTAQSASQSE